MIPPADSQPDTPDTNPARSELRWLILAACVLLLAGVITWHAYLPAVRLFRSWQTSRQLTPLPGHLERKEWAEAASILREARKAAPQDPAVWRASLDYLTSLKGEPRDSIALIQKLQEAGKATSADIVQMGRLHGLLGEMSKAQAVYDALPPETRESPQGQELLADLLESRGQRQLAKETRRKALLHKLQDPDSLRQLAELDLVDDSPARRSSIRAQLWDFARASGSNRTTAIELLSRDRELTTLQAAELRQIVATSFPENDPLRLRVISAQIRLSPQLREELIDQELVAWKDRPPGQAGPLLAWLAEEREHPRILRLVPAPLAAKFTGLLPWYVDALRQTGKWQDLDDLLTSGCIDPTFPSTQKLLWQTESQSRLHADPDRPRQMLARLFEEAGRGRDLLLTIKTGELAERLGHRDLARRYYTATAEKHAYQRPHMLAKVYTMAVHEHDAPAMLEACTTLSELQPDNLSLLAQKLYLHLLLGVEIEIAELQLPDLEAKTPPSRLDQLHLLTALLAHRQGRPDVARTSLSKIVSPSALPVGQRAVYAGLLKSSGGNASVVFQLLEKISPPLLLPEERKFAEKAW